MAALIAADGGSQVRLEFRDAPRIGPNAFALPGAQAFSGECFRGEIVRCHGCGQWLSIRWGTHDTRATQTRPNKLFIAPNSRANYTVFC